LLCGVFKVVKLELPPFSPSSGVTISGIADIADLGLEGFSRAVVLGIVYPRQLVEKLGEDIAGFHDFLQGTREKMLAALEHSAQFLQGRGYKVRVTEISRNLPGLVGEFSHKTAATRAGLGWIGKNALLVVKGLGCGFRLGSLLTDAPLVPGEPVIASHCGTCRACVDACPYSALKGTNWRPGISREELLAAAVCDEKRQAFIPELGFKHPCGLCIQACPQDKRSLEINPDTTSIPV
jgi:epoxyqueuosine reductase QueG